MRSNIPLQNRESIFPENMRSSNRIGPGGSFLEPFCKPVCPLEKEGMIVLCADEKI